MKNVQWTFAFARQIALLPQQMALKGLLHHTIDEQHDFHLSPKSKWNALQVSVKSDGLHIKEKQHCMSIQSHCKEEQGCCLTSQLLQ